MPPRSSDPGELGRKSVRDLPGVVDQDADGELVEHLLVLFPQADAHTHDAGQAQEEHLGLVLGREHLGRYVHDISPHWRHAGRLRSLDLAESVDVPRHHGATRGGPCDGAVPEGAPELVRSAPDVASRIAEAAVLSAHLRPQIPHRALNLVRSDVQSPVDGATFEVTEPSFVIKPFHYPTRAPNRFDLCRFTVTPPPARRPCVNLGSGPAWTQR